MAVDRLALLRQGAGIGEGDELGTPGYGSTNAGGGGEGNPDGHPSATIQRLQKLHTALKYCVQTINASTDCMNKAVSDLRTVTSSKKEDAIAETVSKAIDEGKLALQAGKKGLDELQSIVDDPRSHGATPAESQMGRGILASTSNIFRNAIKSFMKAQEDYRGESKSRVGRQLKLAYPHAKPEEIEELVHQDPKAARDAIQQQMRGGDGDLTNVLMDLDSKYDGLHKLEESVVELHDMFMYMNALVEKQSKSLDNIADNVEATNDYTGRAVDHLVVAKENKDSYDGKKGWCIFCCCMTLLAIGVFWYVTHRLI